MNGEIIVYYWAKPFLAPNLLGASIAAQMLSRTSKEDEMNYDEQRKVIDGIDHEECWSVELIAYIDSKKDFHYNVFASCNYSGYTKLQC